jgi:hypothetical protein
MSTVCRGLRAWHVGVDVHDQLRLQRYSIQKCVSLRKYYKQVFLCIVDMAVVNGYIVHCWKQKAKRREAAYPRCVPASAARPASRTSDDQLRDSSQRGGPRVGSPSRQEHALVNTESFYSTSKQHKRRQYLCKVCSAFADSKTKSFETSFYCQPCSDAFGGLVPLCRHVRRVESGNTLTCSQIWHDTWGDGKNIPPNLKKKIRFRKRKRDNEEEE